MCMSINTFLHYFKCFSRLLQTQNQTRFLFYILLWPKPTLWSVLTPARCASHAHGGSAAPEAISAVESGHTSTAGPETWKAIAWISSVKDIQIKSPISSCKHAQCVDVSIKAVEFRETARPAPGSAGWGPAGWWLSDSATCGAWGHGQRGKLRSRERFRHGLGERGTHTGSGTQRMRTPLQRALQTQAGGERGKSHTDSGTQALRHFPALVLTGLSLPPALQTQAQRLISHTSKKNAV